MNGLFQTVETLTFSKILCSKMHTLVLQLRPVDNKGCYILPCLQIF